MDQAVAAFAARVLSVYQFDSQRVVLVSQKRRKTEIFNFRKALHNNGPGYSALSYLPGGEFASAAQSVSIGTLFNRKMLALPVLFLSRFFSARDFFYVVPGNLTTPIYWCLAKSNLNAVRV